jgi:uncharacterized protein
MTGVVVGRRIQSVLEQYIRPDSPQQIYAMTAAAPAVPAAVAAPTTPSLAKGDRLEVLDVLRGIALLGMFIVHFCDYAGVWDVPDGQEPALWQRLEGWFLDGRFFTMFAMLFGIGFAVQLARADARGENLVPRYLRRLAALAVFGFISEGIFGYNVLFGYAIWGLAFLPIRRWSTRSLFILLLVCSAFLPLWNVSRMAVAESRGKVAEFVAAEQAKRESFQRVRKQYGSLDKSPRWSTVVRARLWLMPRFQWQWNWNPSLTFTLMLAGLIAFRLGIFEDPARKRRTILWWMLIGAASFVIGTWLLPLPGAPSTQLGVLAKSASPTRDMAIASAMNSGFQLFRDSWLAFVYIGGVLLLVAHNRAWITRLAPFAWTGRMALTNYMTQVVFLDVAFSNWALGLKVTPPWILVWAFGLFAVQALFSRWWLSRYTYGPLEWIWRSVTYWRPAPLRRVPAQPQFAIA